MAFDLRKCVIRVESLDGKYIAGTGFVVAEDLAVTCAHVVEALNVKPGEQVRLTFHIGGTMEAEVLTDGWHPEGDIAFLRLSTSLPEGVIPALLGNSDKCNGHAYIALGYPEDGDVQARWPQGNIGGLVPVDGWAFDLLQLQGAEVDKGMSGAPVLDVITGQVVGMLTRVRTLENRQLQAPKIRYAYAMSAEAITTHAPRRLMLHSWDIELPKKAFIPGKRAPTLFSEPRLPKGFIGRENERLALLNVPEDPNKTVIGISGISGIGKTYLASWLYQEISQLDDYQPLWIDCGKVGVDLETLLGDLATLSNDQRLREQAENQPITSVLQRYMEMHRIVLFLEDYHRLGDTRKRQGLESLVLEIAKHSQRAKIVLIGRARPAVFDSPALQAAVLEIVLRGFDEKCTKQYLEIANLTDDQANTIWEKCAQGTPIAMHIFKRALRSRPLVDLLSLPLWEIPNTRAEWLELLLEDLTASGLACIQAASVIPGHISIDALSHVYSGSDFNVTLNELLDAALIHHHTGSDIYSIFHVVFRDYIYWETLTPDARALLENRLIEYCIEFLRIHHLDYEKLWRESINLLGAINLYLREQHNGSFSLPHLLQTDFGMEKSLSIQTTLAFTDLVYRVDDLRWARELYNQVLIASQEINDEIALMKSLIQLASLDRDEGNRDSARDRLLNAIKVGREAPPAAQGLFARACELFGGLVIGESIAPCPIAERYLLEGLQASRDSKYFITTAGIVNNLIEIYNRNNEFEKAYDLYIETKEFLKGVPLAILLSTMARGLAKIKRLEEAWHCIQEARLIYDEWHNLGGVAYTWRLQAWWHSGQGEYDLAEECFQREEILRRSDMEKRGGNTHYLREALAEQHSFYLQIGRLDRMTESRAAYQKLQPQPDIRIADMLGHEATLHIDRENYVDAMQCCYNAVELYEKLNNPGGCAWIKRIQGDVRSAQGKFEAAERFYEEGLKLRRQLNKPLRTAADLEGLADFYRRHIHDDDKADEYLRLAHQEYECSKPKNSTAQVWSRCATCQSRGNCEAEIQ